MNTFLTCPNDCAGTVDFPAIAADQDCTSFTIEDSEICGVLIVQDGNAPEDWTSVSSWETVINNSGTTAADGKYLVGRGGIPVADKTTVELFKNKDRTTKRSYSLSLSVLNMSDLHYEFLRAAQCGDTSIRFWLETVGGYIFGGPNGISPSLVDADMPLSDARDEYERGVLLLNWDADGAADRSGDWAGIGDTTSGGSQLNTVFGFGSTAFGYGGSTAFGPTARP